MLSGWIGGLGRWAWGLFGGLGLFGCRVGMKTKMGWAKYFWTQILHIIFYFLGWVKFFWTQLRSLEVSTWLFISVLQDWYPNETFTNRTSCWTIILGIQSHSNDLEQVYDIRKHNLCFSVVSLP